MNTLLHKESYLVAYLTGLLFISLISAGLSWFLPHNLMSQIANLIHLLSGLLLSLVLIPYCYVHIKRIIGVRRFSVFSSGIVSLLLIAIVVFSGCKLAVEGITEQNQIILSLHISASLTAIGLLVLHLMLHYFSFVKARHGDTFRSFLKVKPIVIYQLCAVVLFSVIIFLLQVTTEKPYTNDPIVKDYQYLYGPHPFRPSQTETLNSQFIDEQALMTTHKCANCHTDIAKQWYSSAHRQAASDKSYETNVTLLARKKGIAATRYCEGCHAPVALLTGQLSEGGLHGGIDNSPANLEGINCQSCHGITHLPHTKGVASYQFEVNQPYLFETASNAFLQKINLLSIKQKPQQHKQDMAAAILSKSQYCASCHAQFIDKDLNDWGWVKMQDEYSAWLESPYSGNNDPQFAHANRQRCQDCHMPLVKSDDPSANADGKVRDHRFIAANTMLPTLNNDSDFLQATIDFLRSDKVRISIEPPHRERASSNKMPLEESIRQAAIQPYYLYKGELANIKVIVSNSGVGHNFPGGTIDINQAWVSFRVTDAEGQLIYQSGAVDEHGYLDKQAYQYRSLPVDRHGEIVWKHDLFNMVGKASVNIIKAGQSDVVDYQFKVPYWSKGPLYISSQVHYRKLNTPYAKWALQEEYQPIPIVDLARAYLAVPIRDKLETIDNQLAAK